MVMAETGSAGRSSVRMYSRPLNYLGLITAAVLLVAAATREVTVNNHAASDIVEIYLSPASDGSWGDDRLGQARVAAGTSWKLGGLPAGCNVDIRVVYANAQAEERHGVNICRSREVAFDATDAVAADADRGRRLSLINHSSRTVVSAFLSSPVSDDWGEDRLRRPLGRGSSTAMDNAGGCIADLRVVYDNRAAEERRRIDLCRTSTVELRPGWTTSDDLTPVDNATAGLRADHRT